MLCIVARDLACPRGPTCGSPPTPGIKASVPSNPHGQPDAVASGGRQSFSWRPSGLEEDPRGWVLSDTREIGHTTKTASVSPLARAGSMQGAVSRAFHLPALEPLLAAWRGRAAHVSTRF